MFSGLGWQGAAVLAPLMLKEGIDLGVLQHNRGQRAVRAALLLALGLFEALFGGTRHLFAIRNRALALRLDQRYHNRVGLGEQRGARRPTRSSSRASSTRSATRSATCSPLSPARR